MVEVVTLEGIRVEESWFPIQNVDGSVAGIVVNDRSFPIVLKGTTTPKQFRTVYVQQCHIPVDSESPSSVVSEGPKMNRSPKANQETSVAGYHIPRPNVCGKGITLLI